MLVHREHRSGHRTRGGTSQCRRATRRARRSTADAVRHALDRQPLKDVLSGTWLGHPLHPLLTDLPIGFWTSAFTLDLVGGRSTRRPRPVGGAGAWSARCRPRSPGRPTGRHHRSRAPRRSRPRRRQHHRAGVLRGVVVVTGAWSPRARRRARIRGATAATVGGYLGGHLMQSLGVGVDHTAAARPPAEWTRVAAATRSPPSPGACSPVKHR